MGARTLSIIGFGAGGIVAGGFAAAWQAGIGNAAAGTLFATLQSLGASGLGACLFGFQGAVVGAVIPVLLRYKWCERPYSQECLAANKLKLTL